MSAWVLNAAIKKGISFLPFKHKLNYLFQKYITKGVQLSDGYMIDKLTHCAAHIRHYQKNRDTIENKQVLELGTGWYPVVPIGLFLAGADKVYTIDIAPLMTKENLRATVKVFKRYLHSMNFEEKYFEVRQDRVEILLKCYEEIDTIGYIDLLQKLSLTPLVEDASTMQHNKGDFDLIVSNNVLEHVYTIVLDKIMLNFKDLLKEDGLMSHFTDMSDHFARLDKSITIYNFLKYSEKQWGRIDNSIQPQNRQRINYYRNLFKQTGFEIVAEENRKGELEKLKSIRLNDDFKKIPLEEVCISHTLQITQKATA